MDQVRKDFCVALGICPGSTEYEAVVRYKSYQFKVSAAPSSWQPYIWLAGTTGWRFIHYYLPRHPDCPLPVDHSLCFQELQQRLDAEDPTLLTAIKRTIHKAYAQI
jgi:hypothetical protein